MRYFFWSFTVIYALCCLSLTMWFAPNNDAMLYWLYGQHLAWGYTDCPPLVGWITRLFGDLFGNTFYLFGILRTVTSLLTAWGLYAFTRLHHDHRTGLLVAMAWLATPAVVHVFMTHWSYHSLTAVFWVWTLYTAYQTYLTKKPWMFYATGFCLTGLLYAQYEAIFLIVSLLICALLIRPFRFLWRNPHTYFGILLLPLILYFPHLRWLSQHQWGGLHFLFSHHVSQGENSWFYGTSGVLNDLVVNYNLFFLVGLWLLWKARKSFVQNPRQPYLLICASFILLVYLLASLKLFVFSFWIAPFYLGFLLLTGPLFIQCYPRFFYLALIINTIIMLGNTVGLAFPQWLPGNNTSALQRNLQQLSAQALTHAIPNHPPIFICSHAQGSIYTSIGERIALLRYPDPTIFFLPPKYVLWQHPHALHQAIEHAPMSYWILEPQYTACDAWLSTLHCTTLRTVQLNTTNHGHLIHGHQYTIKQCRP